MNQKFRLNLSGAAILPIAIALATPAYGQVADVPAETEAEREARLTTVTVTARKRDETLINAPVAVTDQVLGGMVRAAANSHSPSSTCSKSRFCVGPKAFYSVRTRLLARSSLKRPRQKSERNSMVGSVSPGNQNSIRKATRASFPRAWRIIWQAGWQFVIRQLTDMLRTVSLIATKPSAKTCSPGRRSPGNQRRV